MKPSRASSQTAHSETAIAQMTSRWAGKATLSKWRTRFARESMAGLMDKARPGAVRKYDESTERRILTQLDEPPPPGHTTWTGKVVAQALGDSPRTTV